MSETGTRQSTPLAPQLSLDQVRQAGRTAVFTSFGEYLVVESGTVHVVPVAAQPLHVSEAVAEPGCFRLGVSVGVEFGWRHLPGCDCLYCDEHRAGWTP